MKTALLIPLSLALVAALGVWALHCRAGATAADITVAAYYFPNYHPTDLRDDKAHGKGWSEWEIVKAARPRFPVWRPGEISRAAVERHPQNAIPIGSRNNSANC